MPNLLEKKIRSQVIKRYMREAGFKKAVCFSCGNSTKYLREEGVDVLGIGAKDELSPNKWFSQAEIAHAFPGYFNATSGDLPLHLMYKIADRLRSIYGKKYEKGGRIKIGSGETALCMRLAYPKAKFTFYRDGTPETEYEEGANLNRLLELL